MKLRGLIITLGMILVAIMAQAGDLKLSESTIDYGNLKEGLPVIKRIVLTNGGLKTITIANITTS